MISLAGHLRNPDPQSLIMQQGLQLHSPFEMCIIHFEVEAPCKSKIILFTVAEMLKENLLTKVLN